VPHRLQTRRLTLTPLNDADLDEFAELNADVRTRTFTSTGLPGTLEESREEVAESDRAWRDRGHGTWAVRTTDGRFVGVIETIPDGWDNGAPDLGWIIRPEDWGQGFAVEAATSAINDLFERLGVSHVTAYLRVGNSASRRVAEKIGMQLRGTGAARNDDPVEVYELRRPSRDGRGN
jgi:RimJ/RimL family protein N-acetyltransferase